MVAVLVFVEACRLWVARGVHSYLQGAIKVQQQVLWAVTGSAKCVTGFVKH